MPIGILWSLSYKGINNNIFIHLGILIPQNSTWTGQWCAASWNREMAVGRDRTMKNCERTAFLYQWCQRKKYCFKWTKNKFYFTRARKWVRDYLIQKTHKKHTKIWLRHLYMNNFSNLRCKATVTAPKGSQWQDTQNLPHPVNYFANARQGNTSFHSMVNKVTWGYAHMFLRTVILVVR